MQGANNVSLLLARLAGGDRSVESDLFTLVYDELRQLARARLRKERPEHSLQATALVHEAYLRIAARVNDVKGRAHFFALASRVMRQILIDHARTRAAERHGGELQRVSLDDAVAFCDEQPENALMLDAALQRLGEIDPKQVEIVEMRFFSGMTVEEIALVLGVSSRTVKREWRTAKALLEAELASGQR